MPKNNSKSLRLPRRKQFTILDVIEANASLNASTVRARLNACFGTTVTLVGKVKTGTRGRPAFLLARCQ